MWRLRVQWTGSGVVGPSVSTFYALDGSTGFPAAVRSLFDTLKVYIPSGTSIVVPNNGDKIDPATGALTGAWVDGAVTAPVACSSSGNYAKGVGCQIRWSTTSIVGGRRVQGSTFIVPLSATLFDTTGTLVDLNQQSIQAAANNYVTAAPYACIWSRPVKADSTRTPPRAGRAGSTALITGATVPDRASWLLTRRT